MQLNITTDYAIRIILYLYMADHEVTVAEIGDKMAVSPNYLPTITKKLSKKGLVESRPGRNGGLTVVKPADEVTLWDIISTMEKTMKCNRCLEEDEYCSRFATKDCPVRKFYQDFQAELEDKLMSLTIKDLLDKVHESD